MEDWKQKKISEGQDFLCVKIPAGRKAVRAMLFELGQTSGLLSPPS